MIAGNFIRNALSGLANTGFTVFLFVTGTSMVTLGRYWTIA
jgi:hypothetical protein